MQMTTYSEANANDHLQWEMKENARFFLKTSILHILKAYTLPYIK